MQVSNHHRKDAGLTLIGVLFLILFAYGIYAVAFKPGRKAGQGEADAATPGKPSVVIYTTPSCEPCGRAKTWMTQRQVAFEERNVEWSPIYADELKKFKSQIVPVILVNGQPLYGFQSAYVEEALKLAAQPRRN